MIKFKLIRVQELADLLIISSTILSAVMLLLCIMFFLIRY